MSAGGFDAELHAWPGSTLTDIINVWTGIGMLVPAAIFVTWVVLRPLRPTTAPAGGHPQLEKH